MTACNPDPSAQRSVIVLTPTFEHLGSARPCLVERTILPMRESILSDGDTHPIRAAPSSALGAPVDGSTGRRANLAKGDKYGYRAHLVDTLSRDR